MAMSSPPQTFTIHYSRSVYGLSVWRILRERPIDELEAKIQELVRLAPDPSINMEEEMKEGARG